MFGLSRIVRTRIGFIIRMQFCSLGCNGLRRFTLTQVGNVLVEPLVDVTVAITDLLLQDSSTEQFINCSDGRSNDIVNFRYYLNRMAIFMRDLNFT